VHDVFPDPLAFIGAKGADALPMLNIHRPLPERVPIGHHEAGRAVVDEVIDRGAYLERIQRACAALGEALEVRFYAHYSETFDAAVLDRLSEVRSLAIDSLERVTHLEAVGRLPKLAALRFGPLRVESADALEAMGVARLERFTLAGTPSPALDLSPLGEASSLRVLRLLGRGKNTAAIGGARALRELALHPAPNEPLGFIDRLQALEVLKLVLGKKESIRAIGPLPALRDLSFKEVALLADLGDLQRFPRLRRLQLSDQKHVREITVGRGNAALEHVRLYSVPALHAIDGLAALPALESLWAYDSRLDLAWSDLPPTLTHFQLVTKAMKGRREHDAAVRAHGLIPALHPKAEFFYK